MPKGIYVKDGGQRVFVGGDNSGDAFGQERSKMIFYKDFIYNIFK
jgi:hypothetical protein